MTYDQFMVEWKKATSRWKQKNLEDQVIMEALKLFPELPPYPIEKDLIPDKSISAKWMVYSLPPEGSGRRVLLKTGTHGEDEIRIYPPDATDPIEE